MCLNNWSLPSSAHLLLDLDVRHSRLNPALLIGQMTADEPEEGEFEFGEEGRFQKSHLRLHCRLWYR